MRKTMLLILPMIAFSLWANAQEVKKDSGFVFTTVKECKITPVKNQASSGTCWCYSSLSFLESELMRLGKPEMNLSEMYVVYYAYQDKMENYVRYHGDATFSEGGAFCDIPHVISKYGIVPDTIYKGLNYGETQNKHSELSSLLKAYGDVVIEKKNGNKLSTAWMKGYKGILDAYLGDIPEKFTYEGKQYTPQSYAKSLELNMDDYVSVTSFSHHPYWSKFIIEVPDNWLHAESYNVPLDEFCEIAEAAVMNGYTVAWGSDVSEKYFKTGIAMVPDAKATEGPGSDQSKWLNLSQSDRERQANDLKNPVPEMVITPELRQEGYDNYQTTDDHGMHIYGIAKDQNGTKYFMVKNSWGESGPYKGIWYVSQNFFKYKTLNFMVHKDAIPKKFAKKMGL